MNPTIQHWLCWKVGGDESRLPPTSVTKRCLRVGWWLQLKCRTSLMKHELDCMTVKLYRRMVG